MTRQEFYKKYGSVRVKFKSYYKYSFNFVGELPDGSTLSCDYGGSVNDIYKFSVVF